MMPFRDVVRRVALHSKWGLSYAVHEASWPTWQEDLKREVLRGLAETPPRARGLRTAAAEPEDSAPTAIPPEFWAKADFYPEHMLADTEAGMVWQKGEPCPLLYMDVVISRADIDQIWPPVSPRKRAGKISAFAALAREWHDEQEDARLNNNPGVGFAVAWSEGAKPGGFGQSQEDGPRQAPRRPSGPKRDTYVGEALAYVALGRWGEKFSAVPLHLADWHAVFPLLDQFREAALRRDLTVWGRRTFGVPFEEIPWTYWREHGLEVQSLMMSRALTVPLAKMEDTLLFVDVMVSRSEVERVWPHAG